ncbi:MAG: hypothetical protein ACE37E_17250 [Hyphomicrobiales bacterium]
MPLQNRVHPSGSLHAVSSRGTLMGNRGGRIHDPDTRNLLPARRWASRAWIACVLSFKGRQRTLWGESYTELFFLDEVTALAAGHRPCFECRRPDAKAFQAALFNGLKDNQGSESPPKAPVIDRLLHEARVGEKPSRARLRDLPAASMIVMDDQVFAIRDRALFPWSFDGYGKPLHIDGDSVLEVVTPAPVIAALRGGYRPNWHDSARQGHETGP